MREQVLFIDTRDMAWEPLGPPGLFTKRLSRDPATGEGTMLARLPAGWRGAPDRAADRGYAHRLATQDGAPVASDGGAVVYVNLGPVVHAG